MLRQCSRLVLPVLRGGMGECENSVRYHFGVRGHGATSVLLGGCLCIFFAKGGGCERSPCCFNCYTNPYLQPLVMVHRALACGMGPPIPPVTRTWPLGLSLTTIN